MSVNYVPRDLFGRADVPFCRVKRADDLREEKQSSVLMSGLLFQLYFSHCNMMARSEVFVSTESRAPIHGAYVTPHALV